MQEGTSTLLKVKEAPELQEEALIGDVFEFRRLGWYETRSSATWRGSSGAIRIG